ncbi:hypothetical protein RHSIM_Rhsim12G0020800 [Rhododendron simsii]|uniref:Uncharacterized protein n=1 Tax=Rhododendron simsii TaxID=118357 RepID=A0A834G7H7_RHOSS|nr:hypothetical protein RHSIM_Rhsim12G0020800 [Rhododendron simsii]
MAVYRRRGRGGYRPEEEAVMAVGDGVPRGGKWRARLSNFHPQRFKVSPENGRPDSVSSLSSPPNSTITTTHNCKSRSDLGNAKLYGKIVPELGKLERLQYLELYMNKLVGPIPNELGGLKNLVSLDLYHNNLTGSIPPSLSSLSNLRFLDASNNDLCGTIPTSGSFSKFTEESFVNNPKLEGPELMGFVRYDAGGCN